MNERDAAIDSQLQQKQSEGLNQLLAEGLADDEWTPSRSLVYRTVTLHVENKRVDLAKEAIDLVHNAGLTLPYLAYSATVKCALQEGEFVVAREVLLSMNKLRIYPDQALLETAVETVGAAEDDANFVSIYGLLLDLVQRQPTELPYRVYLQAIRHFARIEDVKPMLETLRALKRRFDVGADVQEALIMGFRVKGGAPMAFLTRDEMERAGRPISHRTALYLLEAARNSGDTKLVDRAWADVEKGLKGAAHADVPAFLALFEARLATKDFEQAFAVQALMESMGVPTTCRFVRGALTALSAVRGIEQKPGLLREIASRFPDAATPLSGTHRLVAERVLSAARRELVHNILRVQLSDSAAAAPQLREFGIPHLLLVEAVKRFGEPQRTQAAGAEAEEEDEDAGPPASLDSKFLLQVEELQGRDPPGAP